MILPPEIHEALVERTGSAVRRVQPVSGGMVNQAARVETAAGFLFVKWRHHAPAGFFTQEADGLERLRASGAIRVPEVIVVSTTPAFLALEYIDARRVRDPVAFARRFGESLAALHRGSLSPSGAFGLEYDNYLGALPQRNTPTLRWSDFYRNQRLLPQIDQARRQGLLPTARERLLEQVVAQSETLLYSGYPASPCLIHGDLWSGNFLAANDEPILIDPAISYSHREVEMAYTELFGGFPPGFLDAYNNAFPLDEGYSDRRPLHQLYPLLVHLNYFGEEYGLRVEETCRTCLR